MFCQSYNDFFQVLGNPTNQTIINVLLKKERTVSEIIDTTKLEQSKVSHSLKRMYECKIVHVKRDGKQRVYSLNKETIVPILEIVDKHARKMCPTCTKLETGSNSNSDINSLHTNIAVSKNSKYRIAGVKS